MIRRQWRVLERTTSTMAVVEYEGLIDNIIVVWHGRPFENVGEMWDVAYGLLVKFFKKTHALSIFCYMPEIYKKDKHPEGYDWHIVRCPGLPPRFRTRYDIAKELEENQRQNEQTKMRTLGAVRRQLVLNPGGFRGPVRLTCEKCEKSFDVLALQGKKVRTIVHWSFPCPECKHKYPVLKTTIQIRAIQKDLLKKFKTVEAVPQKEYTRLCELVDKLEQLDKKKEEPTEKPKAQEKADLTKS